MKLEEFYKDKKVLITGSTGFKGAWLSLYLHGLGAKVYGFSKSARSSTTFYNICKIAEISVQIEGDIIKYQEIDNCIKEVQPDIIFHLAAQALTISAYEQPLQTFQTNGIGTANILESLRLRDKPCHAVIVTSDKCYRNNEWMRGYHENDVLAGIDPYSASKSVAEIICHSYFKSYFAKSETVSMATCRAGNVIGGGDWNKHRIVPDCIRAWSDHRPIQIRNPDAIRPWNYVLDVLTGYLRTGMELKRLRLNGESFNFGPRPESEISVIELVQELWRHWGGSGHDAYTMAANQAKYFEHTYLRLNSEKATRVLGWEPHTDISESLKACANWYKTYSDQPDEIVDYSIRTVERYKNSLSS